MNKNFQEPFWPLVFKIKSPQICLRAIFGFLIIIHTLGLEMSQHFQGPS